MKKNVKIILLAAVGILVAVTAAVSVLSPMKVLGAALSPGDYEDAIEEEGRLFARNKWNLFAPQSLVVEEILVEEGDFVKAGDLLLKLDNELLSRQVEAGKNAVELQLTMLEGELAGISAQKNQYAPSVLEETVRGIGLKIAGLETELAAANEAYERQKTLFESGFAAKAELEAAERAAAGIKTAIEELKSAAALQKEQMTASYRYYLALEKGLTEQIESLRRLERSGGSDAMSAQLSHLSERTSVFSPADGTVLFVGAKKGELADPMNPILTIYEKGRIGVESFVLATDAREITPGMACEIEIDGKEKRVLPATVTAVSLAAQEIVSELGLSESRVKVTLSLPDGENLIVGQKVDVKFILERKMGAVAVPKSAVFDYEEGFAVMAEKEGRARLMEIEKLFETDAMVVIKSGLSAGDVVILIPDQDGLKEGKKISVNLG